jgi:CBS domain-containing protein
VKAMTVGKFCNRDVVVARKSSTILEVAKLMRQHHVGDIVIVDMNGDQPKPIGIITDRDIVMELIACDVPLDDVLAGDIMSHELVTVPEQDSVWDAMNLMRTNGIRRLPVVNEENGLEGIITIDDLHELLGEELMLLTKVPFREQLHEKEKRP